MLNSLIWLKNVKKRLKTQITVMKILGYKCLILANRGLCQHCKKSKKTINHMETRCNKRLAHVYTRNYNFVLFDLHLMVFKNYGFSINNLTKNS